jgi:hypothetical protein
MKQRFVKSIWATFVLYFGFYLSLLNNCRILEAGLILAAVVIPNQFRVIVARVAVEASTCLLVRLGRIRQLVLMKMLINPSWYVLKLSDDSR